MAAITGTQIKRLFTDGQAAQLALFALRNVTTGDTVDLGPNGANTFLNVKQATMVGATIGGSAVATVTAGSTVVTMPAGLSGDAIYLTVWGDAAT